MACAMPGSRIYIETTGVADPDGILEAIAPIIGDGMVAIRKIIITYDASRHATLGKDQGLVNKQVKTADLIVLNKCDLVSAEEIEKAAADLARINPLAPVVKTVACIIDPEEVMKSGTRAKLRTGTEATSGAYRSFAFLIDSPLLQSALKKWLRTLPRSVIRVKGFVKLKDHKGLFEVQATHRQSSITPFSSEGRPRPIIIVIAHPMRTDGLFRGLQRCVACA
jgi:G3E family GTPase